MLVDRTVIVADRTTWKMRAKVAIASRVSLVGCSPASAALLSWAFTPTIPAASVVHAGGSGWTMAGYAPRVVDCQLVLQLPYAKGQDATSSTATTAGTFSPELQGVG